MSTSPAIERWVLFDFFDIYERMVQGGTPAYLVGNVFLEHRIGYALIESSGGKLCFVPETMDGEYRLGVNEIGHKGLDPA